MHSGGVLRVVPVQGTSCAVAGELPTRSVGVGLQGLCQSRGPFAQWENPPEDQGPVQGTVCQGIPCQSKGPFDKEGPIKNRITVP